MYKYELHLHTQETSRCGHVPAAEQVRIYHELGYTGVCITDHLHDGYYDPSLDDAGWHEAMEQHLKGYRAAKAAGDALGMDVILGAELRFPENNSDYLVYGIDEDWLFNNPHMCSLGHKAFYERYKDEVLIIHAHPFRDCDEVFWDCVHGLEIVNCSPRHDSRNRLALELANEHPHLFRTVGSDAHRPGDQGHSAILTEKRIPDSFALKEVITSGQYRLWCPAYKEIIQESEAFRHV